MKITIKKDLGAQGTQKLADVANQVGFGTRGGVRAIHVLNGNEPLPKDTKSKLQSVFPNSKVKKNWFGGGYTVS